jgi:hypothetical protein
MEEVKGQPKLVIYGMGNIKIPAFKKMSVKLKPLPLSIFVSFTASFFPVLR